MTMSWAAWREVCLTAGVSAAVKPTPSMSSGPLFSSRSLRCRTVSERVALKGVSGSRKRLHRVDCRVSMRLYQ
ncbi:hypothetical protein DSECCO2_636520 [anaerobic digester metagenome]